MIAIYQTLFDALVEQVNNDTALIHRGRYVDTSMLIGLDDAYWRFRIQSGRITEYGVIDTPVSDVLPDNTFLLQAPALEWQRFWLTLPPPGSHDLFALLKRRVLVMRGNLHPFMSNLMYFKIVLATPRLLDC